MNIGQIKSRESILNTTKTTNKFAHLFLNWFTNNSSIKSQFLMWFFIIFLLKLGSIFEPPVWDSAMGVFAPAIYLYENQFDIFSLAQEYGWWTAGPNTHSFSIFTWFIAAVMHITVSPKFSFLIIHLTIYALSAWSLVAFIRGLVTLNFSQTTAILSGIALVATPIVLVQIGYMYTESIVMSLGIIAWAKWIEEKEALATFFIILALATKLTALAIAASFIVIILIKLKHKISVKRLIYITLIILVFIFFSSIREWIGKIYFLDQFGWNVGPVKEHIANIAISVWDISLFVLLGFILTIFSFLFLYKHSNNLSINTSNNSKEAVWIALILPWIFYAFVVVAVSTNKPFLPRYAIPAIPFTLIQILIFFKLYKFDKQINLVLVAVIVFSIYNHNGALYSPSKEFSIVERSHAYKEFFLAQKDAVNQLTKTKGLPTYVSREIEYFTSSPRMGYIDKPPKNLIGIYKLASNHLKSFPNEFNVLYSNQSHGGYLVRNLVQEATNNDRWIVSRVYFNKIGLHEVAFYHLKKTVNDQ